MQLNPNETPSALANASFVPEIPAELVFDDDPLEPLLYGGQPVPPTPADVLELWRQGIDRSPASARALAAVLERDHDSAGNSNHLDALRD